jgi:hypothetical protein
MTKRRPGPPRSPVETVQDRRPRPTLVRGHKRRPFRLCPVAQALSHPPCEGCWGGVSVRSSSEFLPSVRLSQAQAGRPRFRLQRGVADADPTMRISLTWWVVMAAWFKPRALGSFSRRATPARRMAIELAPIADGPLCLPMTVLQAAGMSKVPREHEWGPSAAAFSAETHRAARGRSGAKAWKPQRDLGSRG